MAQHITLGTILLVEDHAGLRRNLAFLLEIAGFEVNQAANGGEAMAVLDKALPDIILSDTDMPGIDGYHFLQSVRANPKTRHIPFILTSANYEYDDLVHGLELGASDYLPKPFDIYDVLDAIQRAVPELMPNQRKAG